MKPGRQLLLALVLLAVGAGAVLLAGSQTWVSAATQLSRDFPRIEVDVIGKDAAPLTQALGLVALAGVVAVLATRGIGRPIIGAVLVLSGGGIWAACVLYWFGRDQVADSHLQQRIDDQTTSAYASEVTTSAWPLLAVFGGLLVIAGALVVVVRGRGWPGMGKRYDSPVAETSASRPPSGPSTAPLEGAELWKSLDRGEDPTR